MALGIRNQILIITNIIFLGFIGKKLCPELVIVPGNMQKYADESKLIREVFRYSLFSVYFLSIKVN